jgi:hypothetical protein
MWPFQLAFRFRISCKIFLCNFDAPNTRFAPKVIVGPTWHKLRDIPTLPPPFPKHWNRYSAPHTGT